MTKNTGIERLAYSPAEAAAVIGISRTKMYELLKIEGFPARRLGGRIVIPRQALERWLEAAEPAF